MLYVYLYICIFSPHMQHHWLILLGNLLFVFWTHVGNYIITYVLRRKNLLFLQGSLYLGHILCTSSMLVPQKPACIRSGGGVREKETKRVMTLNLCQAKCLLFNQPGCVRNFNCCLFCFYFTLFLAIGNQNFYLLFGGFFLPCSVDNGNFWWL